MNIDSRRAMYIVGLIGVLVVAWVLSLKDFQKADFAEQPYQPVDVSWECPNDFYRWLQPLPEFQIIENNKQWGEFLAMSKMIPPIASVNFAQSHILFIPFVGGGGKYFEGLYGRQNLGRYEVCVRYRDMYKGQSSVTADIQYVCRMIPIRRDLGQLQVRFEETR